MSWTLATTRKTANCTVREMPRSWASSKTSATAWPSGIRGTASEDVFAADVETTDQDDG